MAGSHKRKNAAFDLFQGRLRNRDLHFDLPPFEDLKSSALKPPSGSKVFVLTCEMNVIAPVVQAETLKVAT